MLKAVTCHTCKGTYPHGTLTCPKDGTMLQHAVNGSAGANGADPLLGRVLDDRYKILERLGVGGMGLVYTAEHVRLGRTVVVKVLHRHLAQQGTEGEFLRRFQREAKMASQIEHPNAVTIYDFGMFENQPYLVMQFNRGKNLKVLLAAEGALSERRALQLVRQIGDAVAAAHKLSIIHRDLKPENVMVSRDESGTERAQVLDFGIAKVISENEKDNGMTKTGIVLGTPYYMAPEQALAAEIDARTEVYSLGVMLYEMLTGTVPFKADNPMQVMMLHLKEKPAPFAAANPKVACSSAVEAIVMKALKKEPPNRYQTVNELLDAVSLALQPATPSVRQSSPDGATLATAAVSAGEVRGRRKRRSIPAICCMVFIGGTMGFALNPVVDYFSSEAIARRAQLAKNAEEAAEHVKQGRALAKAGNAKAAVYEFTRALELEPENASTYLSLGRLYAAALQDDQALIVLEKAVKLDPSLEEAALLLGNIHLRRNEYEDAITAYQQVLDLNPKNKDAKKNLQTCREYLHPPSGSR